MELRTVAGLVCSLAVGHMTGCAASPPAYVRADVTPVPPREGTPVTLTDQEPVTALVSTLLPGVGMGHRSQLSVFGVPTHRIRLTRADGKVDVVTIYNSGSAWTEGHGDWMLIDEKRAVVQQWLVSAQSGEFE